MSTNRTDEIEPTLVGNASIRFSSCEFNVDAFGCTHSANEIVTIWNKLVKDGFPLNEILSMLRIADEPIEVVRTVDALECCRSIYDFDTRSGDLKKDFQPS